MIIVIVVNKDDESWLIIYTFLLYFMIYIYFLSSPSTPVPLKRRVEMIHMKCHFWKNGCAQNMLFYSDCRIGRSRFFLWIEGRNIIKISSRERNAILWLDFNFNLNVIQHKMNLFVIMVTVYLTENNSIYYYYVLITIISIVDIF